MRILTQLSLLLSPLLAVPVAVPPGILPPVSSFCPGPLTYSGWTRSSCRFVRSTRLSQAINNGHTSLRDGCSRMKFVQ